MALMGRSFADFRLSTYNIAAALHSARMLRIIKLPVGVVQVVSRTIVRIALLMVMLPLAHSAVAQEDNRPLKPIVMQLKWKHQFQFAGFYAAVEKGYYADAGFDVTLKAATPDINPIEEVLSGRADYSVANAELVLYRMLGKPVTALATIIQHDPLMLISRRDSGILSPQDLIGKRVMYPQGAYGANTQGILLKEGVSSDQIIQVPLSFNINDLIEGNVDAMVGYITDQPYQLERRNILYNVIDPRSYGIDFYGDTLFTTEARASKEFDEVTRFREATLMGWRYAVDHSDEIIKIIKDKYQSEKSIEELQFEARKTIEFIVPELVSIGHMNPGRWASIANVYSSLGLASGHYDEDAFVFAVEKRQMDKKLQTTLIVSVSVVGITVFGLLMLMLFNNRLKNAVAEKTRDLQSANDILIHKTEELMTAEQELSGLNHELERRVQARTEALEAANRELTLEIAERHRRELSLQTLSMAIENSNSSVLVVDDEQRVVYASRALCDLVGTAASILIGAPIDRLRTRIDIPVLSERLFAHKGKNLVSQEIRCHTVAGQTLWMQVNISPLYRDAGRPPHYVIVCEDITLIKQRKDEMERLAFYDPLTTLENRLLFNVQLEKAVSRAERHRTNTAMLFIDVDNFKSINDTYGHDVGDAVLIEVARRLAKHARKEDTVARISGDEFALLLSDISSSEAAASVATAIASELAHPMVCAGQTCVVTVSIGISMTPGDTLSTGELIKFADTAMYHAKRQGKNNYQIFTPSMRAEAQL